MIFQTPPLDGDDLEVLSLIEDQRLRLRVHTGNAPRRWLGSLRRSMMARAIQGSNSIEGYNATLDDAMAVVEDEPLSDEQTETARAIRGYRAALTFIVQGATDPYFEYSRQFLKSLHFMMLGHEVSKYPGQWRPGPVFVVNAKDGETVYTAPDAESVNALTGELIAYLQENNADLPIIKAAMAHLNLTMIHPFKDGNGRMARALQTLVISLGGTLHPAFSSIEEWLGENTGEYYKVLSVVGQGQWSPHRSALPWIRFCLKAHYQQAALLIRRNEEYGLLFEKITEIADRHKLSQRLHTTLFDAALGFRVTNLRHRSDATISELAATRDLKKLCDIGLMAPFGEKRGRFYKASDELRAVRAATRLPMPVGDPYEIVARKTKKAALGPLFSKFGADGA